MTRTEPLDAEVVVVGAGPAGLAASVSAAEAGAKVLLVDRGPRPGGQVWRHRAEAPSAARPWLRRLERAGVSTLFEATVVDAPGPAHLVVEQGGRGRGVCYRHLVLATGARERFLPFPGWTRPGVIGVGGTQALLKQGASFAGLRVVVGGTGPLLLTVAAALVADGARVVGIAEQAPFGQVARFLRTLARHPRKVVQGLGYAGRLAAVPYRTGRWIRAVEGGERIERALLTDGRREWSWECDIVACAYDLVPSLELARLLGCELDGEALALDESQRTTAPGIFGAGEVAGIGGDEHALVTGAIAGLGAAGQPVPRALGRARAREVSFVAAYGQAFAPRGELRHLARPETIVCRCEDVPLERLEPCRSARESKLLTRVGMGPCQSRVCGPALAFLKGWGPDSVRSPLDPVPLSVLEDIQ